ncbi:MAG: aspartyl protease family protein [Planctomycetes bacterium]|nr:aspartyl protease family protein [Planctomycetota bacterium]
MNIKKPLGALFGVLALIALLAPATLVRAQDKPAPKAEAKTDAYTSSTTFRYEGLIFVDAMVNGKGPYNFLFDSGASTSILGERLATELAIKTVKSPMGAQGVGTQDMSLAIVETLRLADFEREEIPVGVMNLDHISGELGKHMHGIIGQNMIKYMRKIEFDFSTSTLSITRFKKGQGPQIDAEELLLKVMIEGGIGGIKIPGFPGGDDDEGEEPAKPVKPAKPDDDPEDDDQFSAGPNGAFGVTIDDAPALASTTFSYRHLDMGGLGLMEVAMWFVDVKLNGHKHTLFFDTGASTLAVLTKKAAQGLKIDTSFEYGVKGVGESIASEGILDSLEIGDLKIAEPTCSVMDLDAVLGQLEIVGGKCDGIVGLPLATRFKRMIVDGETKQVTLEPYGKGEANAFDPAEGEALMKQAVIATWNQKASKLGFGGDCVLLDDWEKLKLKDGGLRVESVEDGAAAKAGLKKGDIITAVVGAEKDDAGKAADMPARGISGLVMWACIQQPGTLITLRALRGGETIEVSYKLDAYGFKGSFPEKYRQK